MLVPELCDNSCLRSGPLLDNSSILGKPLHIKQIKRKSTFLVVFTLALRKDKKERSAKYCLGTDDKVVGDEGGREHLSWQRGTWMRR